MNKAFKILNIVTLSLCVIFTFFQISTVVDLSFSAFWFSLVFTGVLVYFAFYALQFKCKTHLYKVVNKFYEYVPFVYLTVFVLRRAGTFSTAFWYDIVTVILWILITILAIVLSRGFLSEKKAKKTFAESISDEKNGKNVGKKAAKEVFEWVDAFVQAVFTIILLNVFIFQLYEIPSESMVDQFLIGDRVLVFKVSSGPKFPMTKVGLKNFKKYERGDITVFHNPEYPDSRKKELRNFYSQLVFMLTLTKVNLNVDDNGQPIADPLVKRVCGVPGEQLVMLDGVLYHRIPGQAEFTPVTQDAKWANWNLNELPNETKVKVKQIPLTKNQWQTLLTCEQERKDFDVADFKKESAQLAKKFETLAKSYKGQNYFYSASLRNENVASLFTQSQMNVVELFSQNTEFTKKLLSSPYGVAWFNAFLTDWAKDVPASVISGNELYGGDMYTDSLFRMNLMIKKCFANLVICQAGFLQDGLSENLWNMNPNYSYLMGEATKLHIYMALNDSRNMMVFPSNDENGNATYIPEKNYFMMGDNRFNSLDMRHCYEYYPTKLCSTDEYSVWYESNLKPKYVPSNQMMGSPCYRFWPLSRIGIIHSMRDK